MKNTFYSGAVLALLIIGEVLALAAIRYMTWIPFGRYAAIVCAVIFVIWLISMVFHAGFKLNKTTLRKLLANAISPTKLGICYLMAFVLHIGWTSNALNSLFVGKGDGLQAFTSFGISIIGLLVLILFFPEGKVDKSKARKVVFVSGISIIGVNKNEKTNYKCIISLWNIVPLVSVLDLVFREKSVNKENVGEFLILNTDGHLKTGRKGPSLKDLIDNQDWENYQVDTSGVDGNPDLISLPWRPDANDKNAVENFIVWLIKYTARLKYPGNDDFIDGLKISFMDKPCDYDQFDQCFEVVKRAVEHVDNREHLLYFNLTPGTGIVGSLMTLFAIDDNRRLLYYTQNTSMVMTQADKTKVPLENLLSQALENMKNG